MATGGTKNLQVQRIQMGAGKKGAVGLKSMNVLNKNSEYSEIPTKTLRPAGNKGRKTMRAC